MEKLMSFAPPNALDWRIGRRSGNSRNGVFESREWRLVATASAWIEAVVAGAGGCSAWLGIVTSAFAGRLVG